MPIYEYSCEACGRKASIFFRSIGTAEENPECPSCGQRQLRRRMSRVWSRRSNDDDSFLEPSYEEGGTPFYGGDPSSFGAFGDTGGGFDDPDTGGYGEEDVAAFARETRQMAAMMGEPLDADLDSALRHIEGGADPDDVLGELEFREAEPATGDTAAGEFDDPDPA